MKTQSKDAPLGSQSLRKEGLQQADLRPSKGLIPNARKLAASFILIGFAFFMCADLTVRLTFPYWPIDRHNSPNRSWIWWTANDFRRENQKAQIVLLGSSLMVAAVNGGDARLSGERQNNVLHHKSLLLERLLQNLEHRVRLNFSFAICGQMTSDAFFIVSSLLKGEAAPRCIIYGIAPRDLMDNTMTSPSATETFKYLERTENLDATMITRVRRTFWEQVDQELGIISSIYSHRADFIYLQHRIIEAVVARLFPGSNLQLIKCPIELRKVAMFELPEDNAPNESFTLPAQHTKIDNTAEYKSRFQRFDKRQFDEQCRYLHALMTVCRERNVRLVLVNMPVTRTNLGLMPPQFYLNYWQTLKQLCGDNGVTLLNMNEPGFFAEQDFLDSVHLNSEGAAKFMDRLAARLVSEHALPAISAAKESSP